MTISAPQSDGPMPLSEGKSRYLDETMEEVGCLTTDASHSENRGPKRTRTERSGASSAPLDAPLQDGKKNPAAADLEVRR